MEESKMLHEIVAEQMQQTGANLPREELAEDKEVTEGKRESFVFYRSFGAAISRLSPVDQYCMLVAVIDYGLNRRVPTFLQSDLLQAMWALIQPQLDANWRRYENGCKGGAPIGSRNNPNGRRGNKELTITNQELTKNKPNDNVNDNVNDNDNDNDNTKKTTKVVKERHSLSFDERKAAFQKSIEPYKGKYSSEMLNEFFPYWTEPTPSGKKMRFELEKTWEVGRRLATWNKRSEESRKH